MAKKQYVVGTDKILVHSDTPLLEGWEEAQTLKQLMSYADCTVGDKTEVGLRWKGSKMPADLLKQVLGTIYKFPNKETGYILTYRVSDATWQVICPEQTGSGGSVKFGSHEPANGYAEIGTIHTHPNMAAFWSGTDLADQKGKYGVHIVFGLVGGLAEKCLCTIFTPSGKYDIDINDICEEVDRSQVYPSVTQWQETIQRQSYKEDIRPCLKPARGVEDSLRRPAVTWWDDCYPYREASGTQDMTDIDDLPAEFKQVELYRLRAQVKALSETMVNYLDYETLRQALENTERDIALLDLEAIRIDPETAADALDQVLFQQDETDAYRTIIAERLNDYMFVDRTLLDLSPLPDNLSEKDLKAEQKRRYCLFRDAEAFVREWLEAYGIPERTGQIAPTEAEPRWIAQCRVEGGKPEK